MNHTEDLKDSRTAKMVRIAAAAAACGTAFAVAQMNSGAWVRWMWAPLAALPAVGCLLIWLIRKRLRGESENGSEAGEWSAEDLVIMGFLLLYLVSGATQHVSYFLLRWIASPQDVPWHKMGIVRFAAGSLLCAPFILRKNRWIPIAMALILAVVEIHCARSLLDATGGEAVYRDDHPSFMYRFWSFSRAFPHLAYYDPLWNAGKRVTYHLSSGLFLPTVLFLPLWRFTDVFSIYTPALIAMFMGFVPLMAAWSIWLAGGGWTAALAGAAMAVGSSQYIFLWLMHFGTVGACFALAFAMPVCALLFRIIVLGDTRVRTFVLLSMCGAALVTWPPAAIFCAPVGVVLVINIRRLSKKQMFGLAASGAGIAALVLPIALAIARNSDPARFVSEEFRTPPFSEGLVNGLENVRSLIIRGHPLVVFCGIAGVWGLRGLSGARFWGPIFAAWLLLAGWGEMWKPQLQLVRAGIPLFYAAVVPAALWLERFISLRRDELAPLKSAAVLLVLIGGLSYAKLYGNQGVTPFSTMNAQTRDIVQWIRANTPADARIAFFGSTVHAYGLGHVAMLPVLTGREMMAADYYHFSQKFTEYNYPPRRFRESGNGLFEFAELYNVTHVLVREAKWKRVLQKCPDFFEEVCAMGGEKGKAIFKVKRQSQPLYKGTGRVRAGPGRIELNVDDPSQPVVLRYHWVEGMKVSLPARIEPVDAGYGVKFIGVDPRGSSRVVITGGGR